MKVSKDLSVSRNELNLVTIFSWGLGKTIVVTDEELLPLIEALQIEYSSQNAGECHCNAEHAHMTYIPHDDDCPAKKHINK